MDNCTKKYTKSIMTLLLIFILPTLLVADVPIYKDEFLCYDTSINKDWSVIYPQVALGGNNRIIQINMFDSLISPWETYFMKGYNRFDIYGNQLQPNIIYTPFQVNDSILSATAINIPHSNENGITTIAAKSYNNEQYVFIIDSTGQQAISPKCLNCNYPNLNIFDNLPSYGAINNNSKVAVAWYASAGEFAPSGYRDSVFVRIYDFKTDSLSPHLNPLALPLPEVDEPDFSGIHKPYHDPSIGIADDGSFAVAWINWGDSYTRVFYVVYNADYTPRSNVQIAECFGTWADTASCTGVNANYIDLAMESDGDFYITWSVYQQTPFADVRNHVWVRGFNSDGSPKYDPVRVNDSDSLWLLLNDEIRPHVSSDDFGNLLVSWTDARDYPGNYVYKPRNVYVQKIDSLGNLVGFNTRVNNHSGAHQSNWHSLGLNNSGQAMISWDHHTDSTHLPRVIAELIPYDDIGTFVPGDINYDRSADISDLIDVVNYMFGGAMNSFWPRSLTDFDASGVTDIADLVYIVSYMFAGGPEPITPDEGIRPNPGKFDLGAN